MLHFLAAIGFFAILFLLYRQIKNTKAFFAIAVMLSLSLVAATIMQHKGGDEHRISEAERNAKIEQQQLFAEWYAAYQKDIDQLSRNWQWYHHIIESFKEDSISREICYERLSRLADDERELTERINSREIPSALDDFLSERIKSIMAKTQAYGAAQYRTIALSRAAADPLNVRSDEQAEQSRDIQEIMIRESPPGLFIADEIYAVREYLTIPDDGEYFSRGEKKEP